MSIHFLLIFFLEMLYTKAITKNKGETYLKKQFVVIGLGRFGGSVAKTLSFLGHEVMGIDKDEEKVKEYADIVTQAIQANSTDEKIIAELGIGEFDHAVVSIGDDIQASVLTTLILKEKQNIHVTAKAINEYHGKVLEKIGADKVIYPERDMGIRVAHHLVSNNVMDFIELSPQYGLVELRVPAEMNAKTLSTLNIRAKYGCNVIAIKTKTNDMNISPKADDQVKEGDWMVIIGSNEHIKKLEDSLL